MELCSQGGIRVQPAVCSYYLHIIVSTIIIIIIVSDNSPDGGLFTGRYKFRQQFVEIAKSDIHAHDSHHLVGRTV